MPNVCSLQQAFRFIKLNLLKSLRHQMTDRLSIDERVFDFSK